MIIATSSNFSLGLAKGLLSPSETSFLFILGAGQPLIGASLLFLGQFVSELNISAPVFYLLFILLCYYSIALKKWSYKCFCRNTGVFTAKTSHTLKILREAFWKKRNTFMHYPHIINFFTVYLKGDLRLVRQHFSEGKKFLFQLFNSLS